LAVLVAAWCVLAWLARLPPDLDHRSSHGVPMPDTRIGRGVAALPSASPERSGVWPLSTAIDAFATRVLMVRAADRTLDLQYYIWNADMTGLLLLDEVRQAADRGVRVRLLVDDNGVAGMDAHLLALDAHPNVEVRLFNPFVLRKVRVLGAFVDFQRLNRRMHNKSMTADGLATIVGGRNLGDAYFDSDAHVAFVDLDVLAVGKIAGEVESQFDEYWNSDPARSIASILGPAPPQAAQQLAATLAAARAQPEAARYMDVVARTEVIRSLEQGSLAFDWVPVALAYDPPAKASGKARQSQLLVTQLSAMMGDPQRQLEVISPYFVPGKSGVKTFCDIAARGVRVRVVTNSLAANDVVAVHSGYAKWRAGLLACGVHLYELKATGAGDGPRKPGGWSRPGSSSASLHGKVFAMDKARAFVGSFNLDPRSVQINTEMGLVIDSPGLAGEISGALDRRLAADAYELRLGANGKDLQWIEQAGGRELVYNAEPGVSAGRGWAVWLLSHLPIEHLL
jgi:putative cardiolipin synthase